MSRHRSEPEPRYQARYGRLVVLVVSLVTTAVALLGGIGVLPSAADSDPTEAHDTTGATDTLVSADRRTTSDGGAATTATGSTKASPELEPGATVTSDTEEPAEDLSLPAESGKGRRVVFSQDRQRVWLVQSSGKVQRTYLVSGSLSDNLDPGSYEVYSRSKNATGVDDSGTMKWFVRFTQGPTGAAIGFHTIPVDDGRPVQTRAQLGSPQSHGCIRQAVEDATALWRFAPLGTTVVVV